MDEQISFKNFHSREYSGHKKKARFSSLLHFSIFPPCCGLIILLVSQPCTSPFTLQRCILVYSYFPFLKNVNLQDIRIFPTMEQMLKLLSDIQENLEKDLELNEN
ncbi:hypothetical protein P8452_45103 [Trifolium repens]|nr:hypothetical protein P8452_45103 [Trifolium repens]